VDCYVLRTYTTGGIHIDFKKHRHEYMAWASHEVVAHMYQCPLPTNELVGLLS
jgi:hypothetical protein